MTDAQIDALARLLLSLTAAETPEPTESRPQTHREPSQSAQRRAAELLR